MVSSLDAIQSQLIEDFNKIQRDPPLRRSPIIASIIKGTDDEKKAADSDPQAATVEKMENIWSTYKSDLASLIGLSLNPNHKFVKKVLGLDSEFNLKTLPYNFETLKKLGLEVFPALRKAQTELAVWNVILEDRAFTDVRDQIDKHQTETLSFDDIEKSQKLNQFMNALFARYPGIIPQIKVLQLSGLSLFELPECVGRLTQLEKLILTQNELQTLPYVIGNLTRLRILDVASNQIETVSGGLLTELIHLEEINLSDNELQVLPDELTRLDQLQVLDVSQNRALQALPDRIGDLAKLEMLNCARTGLRYLPGSFVKLRKLEEVYLSESPAGSVFTFVKSIEANGTVEC